MFLFKNCLQFDHRKKRIKYHRLSLNLAVQREVTISSVWNKNHCETLCVFTSHISIWLLIYSLNFKIYVIFMSYWILIFLGVADRSGGNLICLFKDKNLTTCNVKYVRPSVVNAYQFFRFAWNFDNLEKRPSPTSQVYNRCKQNRFESFLTITFFELRKIGVNKITAGSNFGRQIYLGACMAMQNYFLPV